MQLNASVLFEERAARHSNLEVNYKTGAPASKFSFPPV